MLRLALLLSLAPVTWTQIMPSAAEIATTLSRAEAFYYEARFGETISLLQPLDSALEKDAAREQERINIKLQLGLAYIGLNQIAGAKQQFSRLYELNPDFSLDAQMFAPKVIALFDEVRIEASALRCRTFCERIDRELQTSNPDAILRQLEAEQSCVCSSAIAAEAADLLYKLALEAYKKEALTEAAQMLRAVVKANSQHELAQQYLDLAESRIDLAADRTLLEWRRHFEAGEYSRAAESYDGLEALNGDDAAASALDQMRTEYRSALSGMLEKARQACAAGDAAAVDALRAEAIALLPDPTIGQDLINQIRSDCVPETCLQVPSELANVRLKTRVNPEIPPVARPPRPTEILAKVTIDKAGNVVVNSLEGGSSLLQNSLRTALERWKFTPAIVNNVARCVETELPLVVR